MQTNIIEVRKNILIRNEFIVSATFYVTIPDVNFIPDEMIVRMITFNSSEALPTGSTATVGLSALPNNRVGVIQTDLVDDKYIATVTDVTNACPGTSFRIKKPVGGQYVFNFMDINGTISNVTADLAIHLEFVKYRQVKETVEDGGLVSLSGKAQQKIY